MVDHFHIALDHSGQEDTDALFFAFPDLLNRRRTNFEALKERINTILRKPPEVLGYLPDMERRAQHNIKRAFG